MNKLITSFQYELRRTVSSTRVLWWIVLSAFPILIPVLLQWAWNRDRTSDFRAQNRPQTNIATEIESSSELPSARRQPRRFRPDDADSFTANNDDEWRSRRRGRRGPPPEEYLPTIWSVIFFVTGPSVCCAMSVLLTAAPAVASEIEQRSWIYIATRPYGIQTMMLGKYLTAVLWGITSSIIGVSVGLLLTESAQRLQIWQTLVGLSICSAFAYAAVYMFLGAILPRRAMVLCVIYTAIAEIIIGSFPAVINRFTVQYRLRALLVEWAPVSKEFRSNEAVDWYIGEQGSGNHLVWLAVLTAITLTLAVQLAQRREFAASVEGDL